jgi:hypothetical protein
VVPRQEPHEQIHLAGALIDPAVAADRSIHGRGGPSAKMRPRPTDRSQPRSGTGPCWVRTALGATGSGWTRAVTTGRYKSQLEAPLRPRARLMEYGGGGFEPTPQRPRTSFGTPRLIGLVVHVVHAPTIVRVV